ncbi:lipoma HMGIC fusion partner-like 1 protein isoform X2 [Varroa jacobsoni]|uniref:Uncharacterized protein n=1 Tax=Varroa destructor TaxID=109461 RepID=A0A7M7KRY6_VARDE|nr:lipoma HMGIC fusion partner-like 1 protein isoform X2 [Varroa destructor]XP_022687690.1 lipoma HMGIC fusion partner-like 1 protein isoform X2 [Varroa jacobsoni]
MQLPSNVRKPKETAPYTTMSTFISSICALIFFMHLCNTLDIIMDCGRYANFWAIPSPWWRLAVALAGTSCALALLVFFIIVLCCAVENSVSRISARLVGASQVFGGVIQLAALVCFAMGLNNLEAREACGESAAAFQTGPKCDLFWAFYVASLSSLLALTGLAMAWRACDIEYSYLYRISTKNLLRSTPLCRMSLGAWAAESL